MAIRFIKCSLWFEGLLIVLTLSLTPGELDCEMIPTGLEPIFVVAFCAAADWSALDLPVVELSIYDVLTFDPSCFMKEPELPLLTVSASFFDPFLLNIFLNGLFFRLLSDSKFVLTS